jgi:hypothetical protein
MLTSMSAGVGIERYVIRIRLRSSSADQGHALHVQMTPLNAVSLMLLVECQLLLILCADL